MSMYFRNWYLRLEHFRNLYFKIEDFRNYQFAMFKYYYFAKIEELVVNQLQFKHIEVLPMFK